MKTRSKEEAGSNSPTVVIRGEGRRGGKGRVAALAAVLVAGVLVYTQRPDVDIPAPQAERTLSITDIQVKLGSVSAVAAGTVDASAKVHSSYSFLFGSAECDTTITSVQPWTVAPDPNGENIVIDPVNKTITIDLNGNKASIGDQTVGGVDTSDCDANWVGDKFGDASKALETAQKKAPAVLKDRTNVANQSELFGLNEGEAGEQIAQTAAATYDSLISPVIDQIDPAYKLVLEYNGEPVEPEASNELSIRLDSTDIDANKL